MSLKSFSEKELAQLAQGEMVIKFDSAGAPIGYFAGGSFVNDTEEQGGVTSMSERGFEEFYKNYLKEIEKEGFSVEENSRVESKEKTPSQKHERDALEESYKLQEQLDKESEERRFEERMKRFEKYVQEALKEN